MYRIQTLNAISAAGLSRFPGALYQVLEHCDAPDAILLRSADLHAALIPDSVCAIGRAGAGVNNIPVGALSERGIVVFNTPGANANAVKELVLAGMLLAARNLEDALGFARHLDGFPDPEQAMEREKRRFAGCELAGKTLGVVGLGAIGIRVANAAHALGMRVLGFDPHMTVEGAWRLSSDVHRAASLDDLYASADYITFHVPLNAETRGLFGPNQLALVKKGVVVLNFARDGVLDPDTLRHGLDQGIIGRYVCDFPKSTWWHHPRAICLPHLGASTAEAEENCANQVVDQVRDFLEHGNIRGSVNFPGTHMRRLGAVRLGVANRNIPNMIGQISQAVGAAGLNILQMHNASLGEYAYNLLDLETPVPEGLQAKIRAIEGVLSVRILQ